MEKKTWVLVFLLAASMLSGCSCGGDLNDTPNGGDTAGDGTGSNADPSKTLTWLTLSPTNNVLVVRGATAASQVFTVTGTFADKHTEDVTDQAILSIDDTRLGRFNGRSFNSNTTVGGSSTVRARVGSLSTSTALTVKLEQKVADSTPGAPAVPGSPETKFEGTVDASRKPELVYPNSGVMVPPNLGRLEVHFKPGPTQNTLFELAFSNAVTDVRVYLRCHLPSGVTLPAGVSRGCIYTPSEQVWQFLSDSNRGGQPVQLTLRATGDSGGTVGVSDPIQLQFARADLKGALYYWTTSGGTGVMRYDFAGSPSQTASPVLRAGNVDNTTSTAVHCVGCHALSRNGKKLVAEVNGQGDGRLALTDLSNFTPTSKAPLVQNGASQVSIFESWNPDSTRFVGVFGDTSSTTNNFNLKLFDGNTGNLLGDIPGTGSFANPADHPDWSADGKKIAYTSVGLRNTLQRMYKGSIKLVTETGSGWSSPVTVVPAQSGKNRYYPAIAPDSSFLVYNESTCPTAGMEKEKDCNADSDPSAMLWAAKLEANATPVELARINAPGPMDNGARNLTNSYPKWSPFVTRGVGGDNSRLMWVTLSSSRMYGLRQPPSGGTENPQGTLLWMAAVDPDKLAAGADPSYPAFALPFQDLKTSNHIAQWAEYYVSNGCSTVGEGCGGGGATCCNGLQCAQPQSDPPVPCDVSGACVCKPLPQCAVANEACSSGNPCCDGSRCVDASGADCQGGSCTCKPMCAGAGQGCDANNPCCSGLRCMTTASGNICRNPIN